MGKSKDLLMQVRERESVFEELAIFRIFDEMEFNKQSKTKKMTKLEEAKKELSCYTGERTVENWNIIRDAFKLLYPMSVINELDGSGYIVEWLKG